MADDNKLDGPDAARFGNSLTAETDTAVDYVANFEGDEIDGTTYNLGDKIKRGIDAGTLAYLVQNGRITPTTPDSANAPAGGEPADMGDGKGAPSTRPAIDPALDGTEQGGADTLVADNSKSDLLALAKAEGVDGVSGDDNKAEIAARIVASRR